MTYYDTYGMGMNPAMMNNYYAHGGDVETEKLDLVHLSPHEVHELDELQGGPEFSDEGVRMYRRLGSMLNHPDIHEHLHHASHHRRMAAAGGHMHTEGVDEIAHHGMHNDTAVAYMPRHMQGILDHMIGGPSHNPIDGKKQYFLGDFLGSMKDAIGGFMQNPGQGVAQAAGAPAGTQMPSWGDLGGFAKNALGNFARAGLQGIANQPQDPNAPGGFFGNMARQGLSSIAQRGLDAMNNPNGGKFDFSRQGLMDMGRNALSSAARYGVGKAFDMADRYMSGPQQGPEMDNGSGAPGSFESMLGGAGSNYGRRIGSSYGSQLGGTAGRYAGNLAGRAAEAIPGGEGYDPAAAGSRFRDMGTDRGSSYGGAYGSSAGSNIGGRLGSIAGRFMDRGANYLNQQFPTAPGGNPLPGGGGGSYQSRPQPRPQPRAMNRGAPNPSMQYMDNPMYRGPVGPSRRPLPSRMPMTNRYQ